MEKSCLAPDGAGGRPQQSATTTVCDPVNGDIWALVETQVSQFRATNLSEFSEGREGSAQDTGEPKREVTIPDGLSPLQAARLEAQFCIVSMPRLLLYLAAQPRYLCGIRRF